MPNQSNALTVDPEGIDAIIDTVAANPASASLAKSLLRETLLRHKKVVAFPTSSEASNDDEEMWDNVPV